MPDDPQVADADTDQAPSDQHDQADDSQADDAKPAQDGKDWQAEASKWRALARKHEGAAKKLAGFEDAQKTEAQRLEERASTAEQRAADLEQRFLRLQVATAKGLPAELAARLQGGSEEELTEDADRLLALVKPAASTPASPPPDARQGVRGQAAAPPDDDAWIRRMARGT